MSDTLPSPPSNLPATSIMSEIDASVERLESEWSIDRLDSFEFEPIKLGAYQTAAKNARAVLGREVFAGTLGWDHLIHEAALSAIDAQETTLQRADLIRLASLCVAAVEAIDRKAGK